MRAGPLRHLVNIQKPDPASPRDDAGQRITRWLNVARDVPANVRTLNARESVIAAQQQAATTHMVELRWSPNLASLDSSCRFLFGLRVLVCDGDPENIDERNRELHCAAIEGLRQE